MKKRSQHWIEAIPENHGRLNPRITFQWLTTKETMATTATTNPKGRVILWSDYYQNNKNTVVIDFQDVRSANGRDKAVTKFTKIKDEMINVQKLADILTNEKGGEKTNGF